LNEAKKVLATEATALVHGRAAAETAAETARRTFEEGALADTLPTVSVALKDLDAGIAVASAFVTAGLATTNGEVRRAIANNAISVNDTRVTSNDHTIGKQDITPQGVIKLSLGRKRHVLLKPV
jgi:tyrosyl-tRNA synthetase